MARVRAADYDEKKQLILDRAAALFARKGFANATMIDVAKACGASKSRLYHYFSSKEGVLFAIVGEHIKLLTAQVSEVAELPLQPSERFTRFVENFVALAADSRNEHLVLMNDLKFLPETKLKRVRKMESQLVDSVIGLLAALNPALMAQEKLKKPYAMLLFGMIIWTFTWYEKSGPIPPDELADRISQLFVRGFGDLPAT
ncbi:MAG: TetR/AcrR family transcriptional regulator [Pseudoxanthomonas sp.]